MLADKVVIGVRDWWNRSTLYLTSSDNDTNHMTLVTNLFALYVLGNLNTHQYLVVKLNFMCTSYSRKLNIKNYLVL